MVVNEGNARRIVILRDDVARRIAAGEVIDRPFSVVRELMDNSIDAKATTIEVRIRNGGIEEIRVVDNGIGMGREDLELCYLSHATSKIERFEDIYDTKTLGFRGEALSSIAACSRLEIVSKRFDSTYANRLIVEGGRLIELGESAGKDGTDVRVSKLFFNMPARRFFLKSKASEGYMCKNIFIEKALPFPDISFKFFSDGKLNFFLPQSSLLERVLYAYGESLVSEFLLYNEYENDSIRVRLVAGNPSLMRKDRKLIQIFINGRRVNEFSLVKIIEYAFSGHIPGGYFPVSFVFVDIDPSLVDFNIHPAKREVKIKDFNLVKNAIISVIEDALKGFRVSIDTTDDVINGEDSKRGKGISTKSVNNRDQVRELFPERNAISNVKGNTTNNFIEVWKNLNTKSPEGIIEGKDNLSVDDGGNTLRYMGQIFNLFLVAVYGDRLIVVDQHAAHERIIFDELMSKPLISQELLFPIYFKTDVKARLSSDRMAFFKPLGIDIREINPSEYEIFSLPEEFMVLDEDEMVDFILSDRENFDRLKRDILDDVACKMAIKEGEKLDDVTAVALLERVLNLPDARCPHGRPIYFSVTKAELLKYVKRI